MRIHFLHHSKAVILKIATEIASKSNRYTPCRPVPYDCDFTFAVWEVEDLEAVLQRWGSGELAVRRAGITDGLEASGKLAPPTMMRDPQHPSNPSQGDGVVALRDEAVARSFLHRDVQQTLPTCAISAGRGGHLEGQGEEKEEEERLHFQGKH